MHPFQKFRLECERLTQQHLPGARLEVPPKEIGADLAFPCFAHAKELRQSPADIAREKVKPIVGEIMFSPLIRKVESSGPYINFYANWEMLGKLIVNDILKQKEYGKGKRKNKTVMIEYSSPNTNKPLHVGHLRNDSIGMAVSNVLDYCGYDAIRTAIINDRGIHICKSMYAYRQWGNNKKPDKKPDHFVGDFYVLFEQKLKENPDLEQRALELLRKWELGDKKTRTLWKHMSMWVLRGMKETYKRFGSKFDFWTFESDIYDKAKPIIEEGMRKRVFLKNEKGDTVAKLEPELPNKVVLRADGTSIYITQDLVLAKMRFEKYKLDKLLYVVASEQNLHFQQLFKIFALLGCSFSRKCHHLSYGLVNLPTGRMKTREGTVVDADELIAEVAGLAAAEISKREKSLPKKETAARAEAIALAAIKYYLLKPEPVKDILFDPQRSIDFEGDTGPYLQYTYARARSILRKSKKKPRLGKGHYQDKEIAVVKKLGQFPEVIGKCSAELKPHFLANYLFELATMFNEFYHTTQVIGSEREQELLALTKAFTDVLGTGLRLLGIAPLEKM
ncbi:MAG: arginine--tRNA ligase [Candidatus Aenigmarchaeota archaeon]|nr:arginine--tRNA ligase [Candidatus Aenigmarchaeota archaeon]